MSPTIVLLAVLSSPGRVLWAYIPSTMLSLYREWHGPDKKGRTQWQ